MAAKCIVFDGAIYVEMYYESGHFQCGKDCAVPSHKSAEITTLKGPEIRPYVIKKR